MMRPGAMQTPVTNMTGRIATSGGTPSVRMSSAISPSPVANPARVNG